MIKSSLLPLFFVCVYAALHAQTQVYVHQSCLQKPIEVINHPEIVGQQVDGETTLFTIPVGLEPSRISFAIDTVDFRIERIWVDSSTQKIDLRINHCKLYRSYVEHANLLTSDERINNLYFDYLSLKYTDREEYKKAFNSFITQYIQEHPSSFLSLNYLSKFAGTDVEVAELLKILEPANSRYPTFQKMKNRLLYKGKVRSGEPLPAFQAFDIIGKPFNIKDINGRATILMFWQSGCKWSKAVMPDMKVLQEKYARQGVQFIYFSLDENRSAWEQTTTAMHIGERNISDLQGLYGKTALEMGISATPYFFVLDGQQNVQMCTFGNEVGLVRTELERLLDRH